jgi:hypothetical protein
VQQPTGCPGSTSWRLTASSGHSPSRTTTFIIHQYDEINRELTPAWKVSLQGLFGEAETALDKMS